MARSTWLLTIGRQIGILQLPAQLRLPSESIVYRILQLVSWRILGVLTAFDELLEEFFYDGTGLLLTFLLYFLRWCLTFPQCSLYVVMSSTIFLLQTRSLQLHAASTNLRRTCAQHTCHCGF